MARIRSDFWVSAHLRLCAGAGIDAVLRRRGAAEAGAVFVSVDRLDGRVDLYGPAPPAFDREDDGERLFSRVLSDEDPLAIHERMGREIRFDPDLWWLGIDDRRGRSCLPLVAVPPVPGG